MAQKDSSNQPEKLGWGLLSEFELSTMYFEESYEETLGLCSLPQFLLGCVWFSGSIKGKKNDKKNIFLMFGCIMKNIYIKKNHIINAS